MPKLPENNEIVMCNVRKILSHSIFLSLDAYPAIEGMLHISEVSSRWVKNIRDFVAVGKSVVCKVVKVDKKNNQVDLSLKRVKDFEKKEFLKNLKKERKIEKMISVIGKKLKLNVDNIKKKIMDEYEYFGDFFDYYEESGENIVKELKLNSKFEKEFLLILNQMKEKKKIILKYEFTVSSRASDGVVLIRKFFKELEKKFDADIIYLGSARYAVKFIVKTNKDIKKLVNELNDFVKKEGKKEIEIGFEEK